MQNQPALIWSLDFNGGHGAPTPADESIECAPGTGDFRWVHINLADQRTLSWIESSTAVPAGIKDMLLSQEGHQRAVVESEFVGCVVHDVERDFDRLDAERIGVLRIALGPRMILTARHHPLRSADIVKRRIEQGAKVRDASAAIDLIISAIIQNIASVSREHAAEIEKFEDTLLDNSENFDHRRLIGIRRRVIQFHRQLSGMWSVFKRLEQDKDLPPDLSATVEQLAQRLGEIDSDMVSVQGQLRLLREEADSQATQRTNRSLYVLSLLSALLLPATLVTGLFGMNTGGLPFAHDTGGSFGAAFLAVLASIVVYTLLRFLRLIGR